MCYEPKKPGSDGKKDLPLLSTENATDEKNQSTPEDQPPASQEQDRAHKAASREDAVDLSLQEYVNKVTDDAATNPVEQAKKRQRVGQNQGAFLASDSDSVKTKSATL